MIHATAPQPLMTYAELQLIIADASQRLGRNDDARDALEEGIRAAMEFAFVGADQASIDAYVAGDGVIPHDNSDLEQRIAEEK